MKTTIENQINSIFNSLSSKFSNRYTVLRERPMKGASCKGMIAVYPENGRRAAEGDSQPAPVLRYAFYASTLDPSQLGSMAIYGDKATAEYLSIDSTKSFLGRKVRSVDLEFGRRPFVDVVFRA